MPSAHEFAAYIEAHQVECIDRLARAVAIPSISADPQHRPDCFKMGAWLQTELESVGVKVESVKMGNHVVAGVELELPPVLLGSYGNDPKKQTILVYGHYDVQPATYVVSLVSLVNQPCGN